MTASHLRAAIFTLLERSGHALAVSEHEIDLIGAGVNSAALIQIVSALEDEFDVELDTERLFDGPLTVARLEAEIARSTAARS